MTNADGRDAASPRRLSGPVVITGAGGFLGSRLAERLIGEGLAVIGTSRSTRGGPSGLSWRRMDLADGRLVAGALAELCPSAVYHLAGAVTARTDLSLVSETLESLLRSTVNVLCAATECESRPRVVLAGSLTEPPATAARPEVGSPYVAAKWAASMYGRMFHRVYGTRVVSARIGFTYGPGQPEYRVIPYVIDAFLNGRVPKLSSGLLEADWVYVDDVITGLAALRTLPGLEGQSVDLGTGALCSVRDVVLRIARMIGAGATPEFGAVPDRPAETFYPADVDGTHRRLGWRPGTSLDEGLAATIRWHRGRLGGAPSSASRSPRKGGR